MIWIATLESNDYNNMYDGVDNDKGIEKCLKSKHDSLVTPFNAFLMGRALQDKMNTGKHRTQL